MGTPESRSKEERDNYEGELLAAEDGDKCEANLLPNEDNPNCAARPLSKRDNGKWNGEPLSKEDQTKCEEEVDISRVPWWCSARVALSLVGFLASFTMFALRVNLSVAIVCMVNHTALHVGQGEAPLGGGYLDNATVPPLMVEGEVCPNEAGNKTLKDGDFIWGTETQGIILSSVFWGYVLTQIPGGWLAQRFGGKRVIGYSMLTSSLATLFMPLGARTSVYLLVALRFVSGLGAGVLFPAMFSLWSKWAPPLERSKLIGFSTAGQQIGNVATFAVSGLLCEYGFAGGWPSIFYVTGVFSFVWFVLWMVLVYDSPGQHPRISDIERRYIVKSIGAPTTRKYRTPWLEFFRSSAVWAIIVGHVCTVWGVATLITSMPAYMRDVLKFDIKANGLASAVPFLAVWVVINVGGVAADCLIQRGVRVATVRKFMHTLGSVPPALFLVGTSFVTCQNPYVAVTTITIAVGFSGFTFSGCLINQMDIAPPFAGVLLGVTNACACVAAILAPVTVGLITTDQTAAQWRIVFCITAAMYGTGTVVFCLFAQGEPQPWAQPYVVETGKSPGAKNKCRSKNTPSASLLEIDVEVAPAVSSDAT